MRIVIELEGGAMPQMSILGSHVAGQDTAVEVVDGGEPSADLLTALGAHPGTQVVGEGRETELGTGRRSQPEDAGAAPQWLMDVIEGSKGRTSH